MLQQLSISVIRIVIQEVKVRKVNIITEPELAVMLSASVLIENDFLDIFDRTHAGFEICSDVTKDPKEYTKLFKNILSDSLNIEEVNSKDLSKFSSSL